GQITTLDRVPIGYPRVPEIIYGLGFSAGFKSFDLSAFFQGSARSSFWINETNSFSAGAGSTEPFVATYRFSSADRPNGRVENQLLKAYAGNHWSESNRNIYALWPRLGTTANSHNNQVNTSFLRDGTL